MKNSNSSSYVCIEKQASLKLLFTPLLTQEERYNKIIEMGMKLPRMDPKFFTPDNLVSGCQSVMYIHIELQNGLLSLFAHSDALISKGLAALLIHIYQDTKPETLLTCPPTVLHEIGILSTLSPTRLIGLGSLLKKLQYTAKKFI